ncbi:hypothetical protein [Spirosoma panaciterrae]|uniref:hypothetical protein n=1 Tax=Spirosoma panaciterrae TaxID=496058 RepID=UPI000369BB75|nr:hypothetical protein [Spirosoma panaciterrae]
MKTLSKSLFFLLFGLVVLASCSRPVAYFQPSAREHYTSTQPKSTVAAVPVETTAPTVVNTPTPEVAQASEATPAPAEQLAQAKEAVSQVEAYVRNDSKLASNKKLAKRMARLNEMMTTATEKAAVSTTTASTKKMSFMERTMLKKLDKKIKSHVAPEKTKVMDRNVRLGLIIGLIGLLLWLLGGASVLAVIGLIMFVVGLVLVLIGVING